jgi:hypothetical protein
MRPGIQRRCGVREGAGTVIARKAEQKPVRRSAAHVVPGRCSHRPCGGASFSGNEELRFRRDGDRKCAVVIRTAEIRRDGQPVVVQQCRESVDAPGRRALPGCVQREIRRGGRACYADGPEVPGPGIHCEHTIVARSSQVADCVRVKWRAASDDHEAIPVAAAVLSLGSRAIPVSAGSGYRKIPRVRITTDDQRRSGPEGAVGGNAGDNIVARASDDVSRLGIR